VLEIDEAMLAFVRRHEVSLDWLFRGCLKGRPKAFHPIDYDAKRQAHIAYLTMVLRLFTRAEQARGQ
jgi:hypothetical protein